MILSTTISAQTPSDTCGGNTTFSYGISTSLNSASSGLGLIIAKGDYALITTINSTFNRKSEEFNIVLEEAFQVNLTSEGPFIPYVIARYGYEHKNTHYVGVGYGVEYFFTPKVSVNGELQLNYGDNVLSTNAGVGINFYIH